MIHGMVSIITLSYQNLPYFSECLQSILQQTYENIEWILYDDGSDCFVTWEHTIRSYLSSHENHLKRVVIQHNKENLGVVKNYEKALHCAEGEYIFYLAIDDLFYDENVIKDVVQYFQKYPFKIATGYRETFSADGSKAIYPFYKEVELLEKGSIEEIYKKEIRLPIIIGACTPFRKELIYKYGFVEEGYHHLEDWPRYLHLLEQNVRFGFIKRCLIKYRTGGITEKVTNQNLIYDFSKLFKKYMQLPYSQIRNAIITKKYLIGWGTSKGFLECYDIWLKKTRRKLDFLVDGNCNNWGKKIKEMEVFSPEKIKEFLSKDIYVIVFTSTYYLEVSEKLEEIGLEEGKHFDIITKERVLALE